MRMARVNITVADEVIAAARAAGLNVSQVATAALAAELERRAKVAALDAYLAELEAEQGPATAEEVAAAEAWADQVLGGGTVSVATHGRPRRRQDRSA
jgi:post-segregation antitoxin (ccd killing protein)